MTREEFVDKIGIANKAIQSTSTLLNEMQKRKAESTYVYINENKCHNIGDRVRVYKLEGENLSQKEELGIGYIDDIFVDDADGLIVYKISKEINKEKSQEIFFNEFSTDIQFHKEYNMLIDKL